MNCNIGTKGNHATLQKHVRSQNTMVENTAEEKNMFIYFLPLWDSSAF